LVLLLTSKGGSGSALGLLLMVIPFGKVVLQPLSGYMCDLYRIHKPVLIMCVVLNCLGVFFYFSARQYIYIICWQLLSSLWVKPAPTCRSIPWQSIIWQGRSARPISVAGGCGVRLDI